MSDKLTVKVLVVEDEAITAKALETSLSQMGYQVVGTHAYGEEAIDSMSSLKPDLVVMDIKLKGAMDGVFTAQRIQAQYDIPVIYLTAYSDAGTLKRALHTRPYGILVKPFKPDELHEAIQTALHQQRLKDDI